MKFMKRSGVYKASNVEFNPQKIQAFSYAWWKFVKVFGNHVVFNNYSYSNSTRKHQIKVRGLMHELGIKIDFVANVRDTLDKFDTLESVMRQSDETTKSQESYRRERKRAAAKAYRLRKKQEKAKQCEASPF